MSPLHPPLPPTGHQEASLGLQTSAHQLPCSLGLWTPSRFSCSVSHWVPPISIHLPHLCFFPAHSSLNVPALIPGHLLEEGVRVSQSNTGYRMKSRETESKAAVKSKINVQKARDTSTHRRMGLELFVFQPSPVCSSSNVTGGAQSRFHAPSPLVSSSSPGIPLAQRLAPCRPFPLVQK